MKILALAAVLVILSGLLFACGVGSSNNEEAETANRMCIGHQGVQEIPANSQVVVCRDGLVVAE